MFVKENPDGKKKIPLKQIFFSFFDKLYSLMLPWENNFSAKFLVMMFNGKIFSVMHHSVTPRDILRSKNFIISRADY